jgi:hypothetical protein
MIFQGPHQMTRPAFPIEAPAAPSRMPDRVTAALLSLIRTGYHLPGAGRVGHGALRQAVRFSLQWSRDQT